jgi:hypothetical protein
VAPSALNRSNTRREIITFTLQRVQHCGPKTEEDQMADPHNKVRDTATTPGLEKASDFTLFSKTIQYPEIFLMDIDT